MNAILDKLNLSQVNAGVCTGPDGWLISDADPVVSTNPTTGEAIAAVIPATPTTYDQAMQTVQIAFQSWRQIPAPKRGLVVRDLGNALREFGEPLGELVTLEMGKIRVEGSGEVQEMIQPLIFRWLSGPGMWLLRPSVATVMCGNRRNWRRLRPLPYNTSPTASWPVMVSAASLI